MRELLSVLQKSNLLHIGRGFSPAGCSRALTYICVSTCATLQWSYFVCNNRQENTTAKRNVRLTNKSARLPQILTCRMRIVSSTCIWSINKFEFTQWNLATCYPTPNLYETITLNSLFFGINFRPLFKCFFSFIVLSSTIVSKLLGQSWVDGQIPDLYRCTMYPRESVQQLWCSRPSLPQRDWHPCPQSRCHWSCKLRHCQNQFLMVS